MAEERVFSIDLGDELGSVYVMAVWKDDNNTPSPVRKPKSPHKQRPKEPSLSLLMSDGLQVWKGSCTFLFKLVSGLVLAACPSVL